MEWRKAARAEERVLSSSIFNTFHTPDHNKALTGDLPWLVHTPSLISPSGLTGLTKVLRTKAPILSPGLGVVVRVSDKTNGGLVVFQLDIFPGALTPPTGAS